jgi:hypothetical protein
MASDGKRSKHLVHSEFLPLVSPSYDIKLEWEWRQVFLIVAENSRSAAKDVMSFTKLIMIIDDLGSQKQDLQRPGA